MHTLNGTAVTGRAMLAIMENFQEADGSVSIPASLHEFGAPQKLGAEKARRASEPTLDAMYERMGFARSEAGKFFGAARPKGL